VVPSSAIGAVPATEIILPILTALENPIGFSNSEPDEIFILFIVKFLPTTKSR
jgi:hypothetical protein